MEAPPIYYCRLCNQPKHQNEVLNIQANPALLNEINGKLRTLHQNIIDISIGNGLPAVVCAPCYHNLDKNQPIIQNLDVVNRHPKKVILKNHNYGRPDFYSDGDASEDSTDFTERGMPVEIILEHENTNSSLKAQSVQVQQTVPATSHYCVESCSLSSGYLNKTQEVAESSSNIDSGNFRKDESWDGYTWICLHCKEEVKDINLLRDHVMAAHNVCFGFFCKDCPKKLHTFGDFVKHVRTHRETLRYYCQYCNLKLDCPDHTKQHAEQHEKNEQICKRCGYTFPNETALKKHTSTYKPSKLKVEAKPAKAVSPPQSQSTVVPLSKNQLRKIKDKSWDGYTWKCQVCDINCFDIHALRSHAKEMHKTCFTMKCADCDKQMDGYIGFVSHVRQHRPYLKRYCLYCNYDFKKGDPDSIHLAQHFIGQQKICHGCGEILEDRNELKKHTLAYNPPNAKRISAMSRERPITVEDLTCDVCSKVTTTLGGLKAHKLLHTDRKREFVCGICDKAFYYKYSLKSHMHAHTGEKTEVCEICNKTFRNRPQLKAHVLTHSGEKPFKCTDCNRRFRLKKQMLEHSLIHTNVMRFQCSFCDKAFRHRSNWSTHQNQHTGERPYRCSECNMGFASWSNCNKHMIRRHGLTLAKTKLTPHGKLPINRRTGEPKELENLAEKQEWSQMLMVPKKKRRVVGNQEVTAVQ